MLDSDATPPKNNNLEFGANSDRESDESDEEEEDEEDYISDNEGRQ